MSGRGNENPNGSRIAAMYAEGCKLEAIGAQFGISRQRVHQIAMDWGCTPRRGPRPRNPLPARRTR